MGGKLSDPEKLNRGFKCHTGAGVGVCVCARLHVLATVNNLGALCEY